MIVKYLQEVWYKQAYNYNNKSIMTSPTAQKGRLYNKQSYATEIKVIIFFTIKMLNTSTKLPPTIALVDGRCVFCRP